MVVTGRKGSKVTALIAEKVEVVCFVCGEPAVGRCWHCNRSVCAQHKLSEGRCRVPEGRKNHDQLN